MDSAGPHEFGATVAFIAFLSVQMLYLLVVLGPKTRAEDAKSHFFANHSVHPVQFAQAAAAHHMRLFVAFWLVYYAVKWGVGCAWFLLSWFIGFIFLRIGSASLYRFADGDDSIFAFLCPKNDSAQRVAGMCAVLGLVAGLFLDLNLVSFVTGSTINPVFHIKLTKALVMH